MTSDFEVGSNYVTGIELFTESATVVVTHESVPIEGKLVTRKIVLTPGGYGRAYDVMERAYDVPGEPPEEKPSEQKKGRGK